MARTVPHRPRPVSHAVAVHPPAGQSDDIIELVMADHRRIRRLLRTLDDAARASSQSGSAWVLAHVWQRLAELLQVHTRAEEEICCLPFCGSGPDAAARRREMVAVHDDIREAIGEAALQQPGTPLWWRAVRAALAATTDHLQLEERMVLARRASELAMSQRRELGRQWSVFVAAWMMDAASSETSSPPASRERRARR